MNRDLSISRLKDVQEWDVLIIGGGATGLGAAVDAAQRGYKTLLLERYDFAKGTSSRSTKLVHGGVRYLQQGNIRLVREALHERGILLRNAPHLVHDLPFVIPSYAYWEKPFYGLGMKVYDLLSGKLSFGASKILSRLETINQLPTIAQKGLRGGVLYHDGQFDDARLALNLAQTADDLGATVLNYCSVEGFLKSGGKIVGVIAKDAESACEYEVKAKVVVNATGVFADELRLKAIGDAKPVIKPSQGAHIVLPKKFLPGSSALMVPKTTDGRVLFAIPWEGFVVVGTTDTPVEQTSLEPRPFAQEIDFILENSRRYLAEKPEVTDVQSVFAGLRPLVKKEDSQDTAAISREHKIFISPGNLLTITGGKWTTYRKMAQDTIDTAIGLAGLAPVKCQTESLRIHGCTEVVERSHSLSLYGSDAVLLQELAHAESLGSKLSEKLDFIEAQVVWAVRNEMARTVEDVLARRTRTLFLEAKESLAVAPRVAHLMAKELSKDGAWVDAQLSSYKALAMRYCL